VTVSYIALGMVGWASTYFFRVATKSMTYAQQLKDYEQAVIQKRFEELQDDEVCVAYNMPVSIITVPLCVTRCTVPYSCAI
jgi:DNA-binding protein Fis